MIISAVFEVVGIDLIIPLKGMMSDTDNVINEFLKSVLPSLNSQNILALSILIWFWYYHERNRSISRRPDKAGVNIFRNPIKIFI